LLGVRWQLNSERVSNQDRALPGNLSGGAYNAYFSAVPFSFPREHVEVDNSRATLYLYDYWKLAEKLQLYGGATADYLALARNTITPPLDTTREHVFRFLPKGGLLWRPIKQSAFRLDYSRTMTGQDLDQSIRLEPTQLGGLPNTFRTAFPDSLVGGLSGEHIDTWHADGNYKFGNSTYLTLGMQHLESKLHRKLGAYAGELGGDPFATRAGERLKFHEESLELSLRHLIGNMASVGIRYNGAHAHLRQRLTDIDPRFFDGDAKSEHEGILHTLSLDAMVYHPSGIFAGARAVWRAQTYLSDTTFGGSLPDESFGQLDIYAGYRAPRRRVEILVGILNVTDENYKLHPINFYMDPPRERTAVLATRFNY
jgi:outer membrane receptor protein involved in Fe transport